MPYVELKGDKVSWTLEGLAQKEVLDLKVFLEKRDIDMFNDCATYLYWTYKKGGFYDTELPTSKKEMVCKHHFVNREWTDFEDLPMMKTIIERYIDLTYTVIEKMYLKLKSDIEELQMHYSNIPWTRKIKVQVRIPMEGEEDQFQEKLVEISNAEEKQKAMKLVNDIIDFDEKLKLKIFKESKENKKKSAMFDTSV